MPLNGVWQNYVSFRLGGKLAERQNGTQTKLSVPHELYRFLAKPGVDVVKLFDSDRVVWASWTYTADSA